MTLWSLGLVRSRDDLKDDELPSVTSIPKVTWPFDYVSCEITSQPKIIISLLLQCLWPPNMLLLWSYGIAKLHDKLKLLYLHYRNITKCVKMMTYLEWIQPLKSHDHIITWSCKMMWQTKIITYPLTKCLWLSILAGWEYTIRSFLP